MKSMYTVIYKKTVLNNKGKSEVREVINSNLSITWTRYLCKKLDEKGIKYIVKKEVVE